MSYAASLESTGVALLPPQNEHRALGRGERNGAYRALEERLARQTALAAGRADEIRSLGKALILAEQQEILVFRSVRELLFNVVKHAGVTTATVSIRGSATDLRIVVEDRGRGCDPSLAGPASHGRGTFGLRSIRQRLTAIGGGFEIGSELHEGTRATLRVPLSR